MAESFLLKIEFAGGKRVCISGDRAKYVLQQKDGDDWHNCSPARDVKDAYLVVTVNDGRGA